ncbi:acyloxyacyl hydrolase [Poriferisphaera sp. WC338]|uniref:acyloxyacyl hydrolase n=1 Tax=Poriferisphaera sp. WC338 TaxID=3425129 RepID=UPI003D819096
MDIFSFPYRLVTATMAAILILGAGVAHADSNSNSLISLDLQNLKLSNPATQAVSQRATYDLNMAAQDTPIKSGDPFGEGSWTFQSYASTTVGDPDHGTITTAHFGFGYYFVDGLSINFEPLVGYVQANFEGFGGHGIVGGFDLLFRWHFWGIDQNETFSIYMDGGAGFELSDVDFPSDSHHDFRLLVGFGLTAKIPNTENLRLMAGARYIHISNANTSDINDGLDAAQLYLGAMLNF